jgi:signal transduction histidine kinase
MEKVIDYFISNNINKNAEYEVKERLIVFFLLFTMLLSVLMMPTYIYFEVRILVNFLFLLLFGSALILGYFKFTNNLKITSFIFITFCLVYLLLNILYTGAISSVLVVWLIILPILAILLDNGFIAYSTIGGGFAIVLLLVFEYFEIPFPNELERYGGIYLNLFSRVNFMISVVLIIYLYDKKRKLDKELLEKSNTELEQFAYVASHDMKAPLRNIMSFTQLLQRKIDKNKDADTEQYIQHILSNGHQMNELIQGLLNISQIDTQDNLRLKNTDLNKVLVKAKTNLKEALEQKNVILNTDVLPSVLVNEPQITQVFQNLIENGIKYNRSEQPMITIYYQKDSKYINIYFSDNGIGISPEYYDRIFEMFKRLHSGFEFKGTGIGLAICKKIALRHEGDLMVESSSDMGTVFKLSLPIK